MAVFSTACPIFVVLWNVHCNMIPTYGSRLQDFNVAVDLFILKLMPEIFQR